MIFAARRHRCYLAGVVPALLEPFRGSTCVSVYWLERETGASERDVRGVSAALVAQGILEWADQGTRDLVRLAPHGRRILDESRRRLEAVPS